MLIKELQLLSEALWESIKSNKNFFSSIQLFSMKLAELDTSDPTCILEANIYFKKIDDFFDKYRRKSDSDIFYTEPTLIVFNNDSVVRIGEILNELKSMSDDEVGLVITPTKKAKKTNTQDVKEEYSKVFIVHGHDDEAKTKAARFVEKLGLEAIILHEQASSSKTIIEKIEEYSKVDFAIILYTPCDVGAKKGFTDNPRARQNVVFEHGYFIGHIGRNKVCALVKGNVETPNDISGVVYVSMDENNAWTFNVAKELKKAGYNIDMNKL